MSWLPGTWEWFIILIVVLVLFGARVPKVAQSLGQCVSIFRRGVDEAEDGE